MSHREVLATGACAVVERCGFGKVTLRIGPVSVRVDRAVFLSATETLAQAQAVLPDGGEPAVQAPSQRRTTC